MSVVVGFLATPEGEAAWSEGARQAKAHAVPLVVVPLDEPAAQRAAERSSSTGETGETDEPSQTAETGETQSATTADVRTTVAPVLAASDLAEAFLELAEQIPATMLVIGLRRRSSVGKLILGSNAQRILLGAPVPVLAVNTG